VSAGFDTIPGREPPPALAAQLAAGVKAMSFGLPEGPVGPGDSWTVATELPIGALPGVSGAGSSRTTLTVKEFNVAGGDPTVLLAQSGDLHLGFRQFGRQTARGGSQREADVAEAFRRAVDDLLDQRPDLIVLAGDIFHSVRPTNAAILFLFQQLQRIRVGLPETAVVMIAGDHDTPRSVETGTILRLYEALGAEIAVDLPRGIV